MGTRNDTLNRAAFALDQLVAGGLLPQVAVVTALTDATATLACPSAKLSA